MSLAPSAAPFPPSLINACWNERHRVSTGVEGPANRTALCFDITEWARIRKIEVKCSSVPSRSWEKEFFGLGGSFDKHRGAL